MSLFLPQVLRSESANCLAPVGWKSQLETKAIITWKMEMLFRQRAPHSSQFYEHARWLTLAVVNSVWDSAYLFFLIQSAVHARPHRWPHGAAAEWGTGNFLWRLHPGRRHGRVRGSLWLHEVSEDPAGLSGRSHLPRWDNACWDMWRCTASV